MTTRHPALPWISAIVSGLLLALCYPNWDQGQFVWIWQWPILAVIWFFDRMDEAPFTVEKKPGWKNWLRQAPLRFVSWFINDSKDQPRWVWGAKIGWVSGFVFFLISISFIRHVAWPGWIVLSAYLAFYFAAWGAFAASFGRLLHAKISWAEEKEAPSGVQSEKLKTVMKSAQPGLLEPSIHALWIAFLNAACWVALEWLRGVLLTGFGWNGLGVAMHQSLHLVQIADIVGVTGLAFWPVFVSCIGVATIARFAAEVGKGKLRPHLDFAVAMVLILVSFFYGVNAVTSHPVDDPVELDVLLVQGNIPMSQLYPPQDDPQREEKLENIYTIYERLTNLALLNGRDFDLIVWPETSLPDPFILPKTQRFLNEILAQGDFHFIVGLQHFVPSPSDDSKEVKEWEVYNAMLLLQNNTTIYDDYRKIHRVPFGEYVPFRHALPLYGWLLGLLIPEDFDPGTEYNRLKLGDPYVEIIPTICFEDTMGRLTRKFVQDEAQVPQVIMNITNDAWFAESSANAQHMANAKFRAIELKRPMIRCANTGLTGVIDRFGSSIDPASGNPDDQLIYRDATTGTPFIAGFFPATLKLDSKPSMTVYARYGDWFALTMLTIVVLVVGIPAGRKLWAWKKSA
tara:strand:+ start:5512 stop:7389 length:1878 start_codon:yes stop_codon:yes gene_type:complete